MRAPSAPSRLAAASTARWSTFSWSWSAVRPASDLAKRLLDADAARQLPPGRGELAHQVACPDGAHDVVGERLGEDRVPRVERVAALREDAHGPGGGAPVEERRDDQRVGIGLTHEAVGLAVAHDPLVRLVVAGGRDLQVAQRDAHEARVDRQPHPLEGPSAGVSLEAHRHGHGERRPGRSTGDRRTRHRRRAARWPPRGRSAAGGVRAGRPEPRSVPSHRVSCPGEHSGRTRRARRGAVAGAYCCCCCCACSSAARGASADSSPRLMPTSTNSRWSLVP